MLSGRFGNTSGRPYIEGRLIIPRLNVQGDFSFLVDTGADTTLLMPGDGVTLGLDYSQLLNRNDDARGAGGRFTGYSESAWLVFSEGDNLLGYAISLAILAYDNEMLRVPSLLGRDVIHRWRMNYDPTNGRLQFDAITADVVLPATQLPGPPRDLHQ